MTRAEELAEKEWIGELNKALNAKVAELVADAEALAEALEVAFMLLMGEGYDRDPDYAQEWKTISDALARHRGEK